MFIQGDLQAVFDALYTIGAIDPVLKLDWKKINLEMLSQPNLVNHICQTINSCKGNRHQLVEILKAMDEKTINFVALEVAREYSEFQDRKELH